MSLKDTKVGDEIAVRSSYSREWQILKVTSATATQIGVDKVRYMRRTGRRLGDGGSYRSAYAQPVTPQLLSEIADELKRQAMHGRINRARGQLRIDESNIDRIEALIAEAAAKESA